MAVSREIDSTLERYECEAEDYWNLPEGERAELINGVLYDMAPPSLTHQLLVTQLGRVIGNFINDRNGKCRVIVAPFAVNLDADDKNWVEPDVSVICDPDKLTERGCKGAPDLVIEVVSPSSASHDCLRKLNLYQEYGVREYWIVNPMTKTVMAYDFVNAESQWCSFEEEAEVRIFDGQLKIKVGALI